MHACLLVFFFQHSFVIVSIITPLIVLLNTFWTFGLPLSVNGIQCLHNVCIFDFVDTIANVALTLSTLISLVAESRWSSQILANTRQSSPRNYPAQGRGVFGPGLPGFWSTPGLHRRLIAGKTGPGPPRALQGLLAGRGRYQHGEGARILRRRCWGEGQICSCLSSGDMVRFIVAGVCVEAITLRVVAREVWWPIHSDAHSGRLWFSDRFVTPVNTCWLISFGDRYRVMHMPIILHTFAASRWHCSIS